MQRHTHLDGTEASIWQRRLFGEPFDTARAIGFGMIWAALAIHLWRSLRPQAR